MAVIDELLVGLGFDYEPGGAKKFKEDIGKTVNIVAQLAKTAVAAATAITGMTVASAKASDEQGKLADQIGETVENVGALQFAQKIAGGSADGMSNSLRELSLRASEAARGTGTAVEAFGLLGISATDADGQIKPVSDLIKEISASFQGLGESRQIELADKLGLRDSIRLLQLGPVAIEELIGKAEELGVTTGKDAKLAASFNDALVELWTVTKQVSRVLSRSFAPILEDLVDRFTDWWIINKDIIEQNIPKWIEQFTTAMKVLSIAMGAFIAIRVITHLMTMIALMRGLTLATLAANVGFFLLPAILGALALAFVALVEDAKVFFEGGESFIGDMIEKYPQWETEIRLVATALEGVWNLTSKIFEGWSKIFGLFDKFTAENIKEVAGNIPGFRDEVVNDLFKSMGLDGIPGFRDDAKNDEVVNEGIGLSGFRDDVVNNLFKRMGLAGNIPGFSDGALNLPSGPSSTSTIVEKLEIMVNGSGRNPEEIAQSVYDVFLQTSQDLNSAVDQ